MNLEALEKVIVTSSQLMRLRLEQNNQDIAMVENENVNKTSEAGDIQSLQSLSPKTVSQSSCAKSTYKRDNY